MATEKEMVRLGKGYYRMQKPYDRHGMTVWVYYDADYPYEDRDGVRYIQGFYDYGRTGRIYFVNQDWMERNKDSEWSKDFVEGYLVFKGST